MANKYGELVARARRIEFQNWLKAQGATIIADSIVGPKTIDAFLSIMSNKKASAVNADDVATFAAALKGTPKQVNAVAKVESRASGFDNEGRPIILFERHYMWRQTGGFYPVSAWNNPKGGGYNADSWGKLLAALRVDPIAALSSASWGKFQIMGAHWAALGYASVFQFVRSFAISEADHYEAFVRYVQKFNGVDKFRRISDNPDDNIPFVHFYNGPNGVEQNNYHEKLADQMK